MNKNYILVDKAKYEEMVQWSEDGSRYFSRTDAFGYGSTLCKTVKEKLINMRIHEFHGETTILPHQKEQLTVLEEGETVMTLESIKSSMEFKKRSWERE